MVAHHLYYPMNHPTTRFFTWIPIVPQKINLEINKNIIIHKPLSSHKCSLEALNQSVLISARNYLIWNMYFAVDHIEFFFSFSLEKIFITMCNLICLVMSSSFCRRPDFQILTDNHTFIIRYFHKVFYLFFSSTKNCRDPGKLQICIYALLKHRSYE